MKLPNCLSNWLYHFPFLLTINEFMLIHILTSTWHCQGSGFWHSNRLCSGISLSFLFAIPWLYVILCIFPYVYFSFVYLRWGFCSDVLLILTEVLIYCWVLRFFLYILNTSLLVDMCFTDIFSWSVACLNSVFHRAEDSYFIFMKSYYHFFLLSFMLLVLYLKSYF